MAVSLSSVDIVGAGPAGLYTSILIRRFLPHIKVRVTEQNLEGATFGFGVVFSDKALDFMKHDDPYAYELILPEMESWQNMTLNLPKEQITLDGLGFTAIGRLKLLEILSARAKALGAEIRYGTTIDSLDELDGDLIIGADGLNSLVRRTDEEVYQPSIDYAKNHFAWFGTKAYFETLTQTFIESEYGPFNAHHYRYSKSMSTFIVECGSRTFEILGFDKLNEAESAGICSELFAHVLGGAALVTNKSVWREFPKLWCRRWYANNRVIIGDAAHTAHFSIGSGTRLAMEDAIALVRMLAAHDRMQDALAEYDSNRRVIVSKIVTAANASANWYDRFEEKMKQPPIDFAFDYLTRSGRMTKTRLHRAAPKFMEQYESAKIANAEIIDPVSDDAPGAREIGFVRSDHANCSAILWNNLEHNSDKIAITGQAGDLTYSELVALASMWGNAFAAAGLDRNDRIACLLDDTPAYPAVFFGAVRNGFVPVLLNTQSNPETLNYYLKDSEARLVITEATLTDQFTTEMLDDTVVERIVVVNGESRREEHIASHAFLDDQFTELACADTHPNDMAFWMYSSGTTGRPKGIVHLHHDMAYTHQSFGLNVLKLEADDICFSVPKIFFAYGFGNSLTFPFSVGATTLLMPGRPRADAVLDAIETYKPTVFFGLPTLYNLICRDESVETRNLGSIRQSVSAAETLSEEIYSTWIRLTGHGITEGLGSTELLHIYLSNRHEDHRIGAAGARVAGYEVKLLSPDGDEVETGQEGIMLVRGHSSTPCYWNRPEKSEETIKDDWIYTGDRFLEDEGYYYFQGRADDLIKISGQWVWPLEVERCLNDHPDVHECAVMAHQLSNRGMTLRAVVCLKQDRAGTEHQTELLQDYVRNQLMPFKYPRVVEYRRELPKTGTGKIDRQALRNEA